jgi:hypothetical protein
MNADASSAVSSAIGGAKMLELNIRLSTQTAELRDASGTRIRQYLISSSRYGAGEQNGSFRTPRGRHIIRAKIGKGQAENTVFVKRRPTGEIYTPELGARYPTRDWILTRILWLSGLERGINRLGDVDTMRRYIYITELPMKPRSVRRAPLDVSACITRTCWIYSKW